MKVEIGPYPDNADEKRVKKVELHDYDTWSLDHTLAIIIHPALIQLKETNHGYFMVKDEDVPDELRSHHAPAREDWEVDDLAESRYNYVLDEMIWAFEYILNRDYIDYMNEGWEELSSRCDNGLLLFGKYYRGLWD